MLAQQAAEVLVLDLERFEIGIDLPVLGQLVAQREGRPLLVLCPFTNARWLPALMAHGPLAYVIGPLDPEDLCREVGARLGAGLPLAAPADASSGTGLAALLAVLGEAQRALAGAICDDRR